MSHARDFREQSDDRETAEQITFDYRLAKLTAAQRAFCDFAVKLTLTPGDMTEDDVVALRDVGYSDEQISLGTQVISYFNYINRVADALGVAPESWMEPTRQEWEQRKARFNGVNA